MAYVYRHIRLDKNEPFYIGIGNDIYYKRARNKSRRNKFWKNIISKTDYEVEILFDNISYDFAKQKEIEFIKLYGRKDLGTGTLVNLTDGGEGIIGFCRNQEYKDKIRKTLTGRKLSEKHRNNISKGGIGRKHTAESKEKLRAKKIGIKRPEISGGKSKCAKMVLNTETNEIYPCLKDVSKLFNINYSTLANQVNNNKVNRTPFIYLHKSE